MKENPKLLAFCVYPGDRSFCLGCTLAFTETRNKARYVVFKNGPWDQDDYCVFNAFRVARLDSIAEGRTEPFMIETNEELPEGYEPFFDDDII